VVGFDATPVAAALGLASVAQPIDQVAHLCIDLLTARLEAPDAPAQGLLVPPVLSLPG
jgi:DNA-binding LacI/PurR family transcriptional regulator